MNTMEKLLTLIKIIYLKNCLADRKFLVVMVCITLLFTVAFKFKFHLALKI